MIGDKLLATQDSLPAINSMSLKAKLEAIIYAAEMPITLDQLTQLTKEPAILEVGKDEASKGKEKDGSDDAKSRVRAAINELIAEYASPAHGVEIREVAGGYRMSTKPEQHDVVRAFAKSLKPPIRLSLPALETLAVIAYKQPATVPEISDIRGVDSGGVIATLLDRKLITTAGRKQVIGRPILYKTTKEFLLRFGLKDVNELPSMEEFEKLVSESFESDLLPLDGGVPDATGVPSAESSEEVATEDEEHIEGYELRKEIHVVASSPASTSTSSSSVDEPQESES
jgi:segregation and condensation protein B